MELCNIAKMYSKEELECMFNENPLMDAEYSPEFLGFEYCYEAVAACVDKSAIIIDVGCALGLQGRYFADFHDYIGIDLPYSEEYDGYPPNKKAWELFDGFPGRYIEGNAVDALVALFIGFPNFLLRSTVVIVSAVPDSKVYDTAQRLFANTVCWYPGGKIACKGKWKEELEEWVAKNYPNKTEGVPKVVQYN